jgi:hypothetical protein
MVATLPPGRPRRPGGFCAEILGVEQSLWTFARVEGVPPTNNAA